MTVGKSYSCTLHLSTDLAELPTSWAPSHRCHPVERGPTMLGGGLPRGDMHPPLGTPLVFLKSLFCSKWGTEPPLAANPAPPPAPRDLEHVT